jgi:hypothetical protein
MAGMADNAGIQSSKVKMILYIHFLQSKLDLIVGKF